MIQFVFFVAAIGAIAGALGVVILENPFYSVLALVCHLLALAVLFLLLNAQFVAAAQVVVYAGAVMVLYVFVVAYVGGGEASLDMLPGGSGLRAVAALACGGLFIELCFAFLGSGLKAIDSHGPHIATPFGAPGAIGQALLTKFLFPFEAASILLLVAAIGAVILARRRRGIESAGEAVGREIVVHRPAYSGTMFEAVGGAMERESRAASGGTAREPVPSGPKDEGEFRGGW
jgi:NADH:ubiquinone oxidoreductase subunit 6 (subunit J)